ncbi:hypothetical protein D5085_03240 [Ectothiorhodospiraceae bacterium BW-2]|nr:hypothetical protein D5085_03240 [Ectothiorhodospiraceae bacterium BW-2]
MKTPKQNRGFGIIEAVIISASLTLGTLIGTGQLPNEETKTQQPAVALPSYQPTDISLNTQPQPPLPREQ